MPPFFYGYPPTTRFPIHTSSSPARLQRIQRSIPLCLHVATRLQSSGALTSMPPRSYACGARSAPVELQSYIPPRRYACSEPLDLHTATPTTRLLTSHRYTYNTPLDLRIATLVVRLYTSTSLRPPAYRAHGASPLAHPSSLRRIVQRLQFWYKAGWERCREGCLDRYTVWLEERAYCSSWYVADLYAPSAFVASSRCP